MIGNKEDAKRALMGEGKYIGEGCTRKCFLIDDVVYKVEFCPPDQINFFEAENLDRMATIPNPPIIIPPCTLWDVHDDDGEEFSVIAMPYYEGSETGMCYECEFGKECIDEDCVPKKILDGLSANRIDDSAYGNFIFTLDSEFVLIDAAY